MYAYTVPLWVLLSTLPLLKGEQWSQMWFKCHLFPSSVKPALQMKQMHWPWRCLRMTARYESVIGIAEVSLQLTAWWLRTKSFLLQHGQVQQLPGPLLPSAMGIKVTHQHLGPLLSPAGRGCSQCQGGPCLWSPGQPGSAAGPPWRGKGNILWPAAGKCHIPWVMGAFQFVGWERGAPALSRAGQPEWLVTDTVLGSLDGTGKQNTRLLTLP